MEILAGDAARFRGFVRQPAAVVPAAGRRPGHGRDRGFADRRQQSAVCCGVDFAQRGVLLVARRG